jgi:hypothetical protein
MKTVAVCLSAVLLASCGDQGGLLQPSASIRYPEDYVHLRDRGLTTPLMSSHAARPVEEIVSADPVYLARMTVQNISGRTKDYTMAIFLVVNPFDPEDTGSQVFIGGYSVTLKTGETGNSAAFLNPTVECGKTYQRDIINDYLLKPGERIPAPRPGDNMHGLGWWTSTCGETAKPPVVVAPPPPPPPPPVIPPPVIIVEPPPPPFVPPVTPPIEPPRLEYPPLSCLQCHKEKNK